MQKIGIYGGSFNPIHLAHLIIADFFVKQLNINQCLFVPTFISPFKTREANPLFNNEIRRKLVELSIKGHSKFKLDSFELDKNEISFTIDTVTYFHQKYSGADLYLLIGTDQANQFHQWKNWQDIAKLVKLVIAKRKLRDEKITFPFQEIDKNIKPIYLQNPIIEISSTEIRNNILNNISVEYLLHCNAFEYLRSINFHNLQ
jgi:nicotinate-nucleotide adenylyltransferase